MSLITWVGYILVMAFWGLSIWREGGLGIGIRFMYGMNLFLFFLLGPLLGEISGQDAGDRFFRYPMEPAIHLALLGMAVYVATSYWLLPFITWRRTLIPPNFARSMANPERLQVQHLVAWNFIIIGLLCSPLMGLTQGLPTIGAVLSQTLFLVDSGLLMLCLNSAYSGKKRSLLLGMTFYVLKYLLFTSLSGHAGSMFINSMVMFCIWLFTVRIRLIYLPALLVVAVTLFIPAAYWLNGRERLRDAISEGVSTEEKMNHTVNIFLNPPPLNEINLVQSYRNRGDFSDLMAASMVHTPAIEPYAYGETYYRTMIAIFPRALWPDKPFSLGGSEFVSRYTGITFRENTSVGMNYMFEMYVNFGHPGVIIGMIVLGLILGGMEILYYTSARLNIYYECVIVQTGWTVCFLADKLSDMLMIVIPGVVLIWTVYRGLQALYSLPKTIPATRFLVTSPTG